MNSREDENDPGHPASSAERSVARERDRPGNSYSLIKGNEGQAAVNFCDNAQMTTHVGDVNVKELHMHIQNPTDIPGTSQASSSTPPTASIEQELRKKEAEICDVINSNAWEMTKVKVVENFRKDILNEPDFMVYPQMRKAKRYFEGGYEKWEDMEIETTSTKCFRNPRKKISKNQIRREMGFYYQKRQENGENITVEELVSLMSHNESAVKSLGVVASAGSGKTTLLRRIARQCLQDWVSMKSLREQGESVWPTGELKMIHYIEMKNIKYQKESDVANFLFGGLFKSKKGEREAYEWLLKHQSEAVIFFDGFDQANWDIKRSSSRRINPFEKANTAEIMYNLLSQQLLGEVRIVIASREFKISELPADARPNDVISLVGFTKKDAKRLFVSLIGGDRGAELWKKIENLSQRLLNLVSVPVFLVLTAAVLAGDPDSPPPATITELYNRVLLSLRRLENIRERDQIMVVIKKLKRMAHQGMAEGRVVFHHSDLTKCGLTIEDARDLIIKVPGNNLLSRYLFVGDFVFFFCHQSFQEFLSASFVAEMQFRDFSRFNDKHLHQSRWSVVRTFVGGIIHNESNSDLHKVSDADKKRFVFKKAIEAEVKKGENGSQLLAAIFESNNEALIQSLPFFPSLRNSIHGPDEAHMFGSVLARREGKKEKSIDICNCGVDDDLMDIIVQNLESLKIRVGELNLLDNSFKVERLNSLLTHLDADRTLIGYQRLKEFDVDLLNWKNIRTIDWGHLKMINESEAIKITFHKCKEVGYFDKKTKASEKDQRLSLPEDEGEEYTMDLIRFFNQKYFDVAFKKQIYLAPDDLEDMRRYEVTGKIDKILLDCRSQENVKSSLIVFIKQRFQGVLFDLVVNDETSFDPSHFLNEITSSNGNISVHWWFRNGGSESRFLTRLLTTFSHTQIREVETLRLRIDHDASYENIEAWLQTRLAKKFTLVYEDEKKKSEMNHAKLVKFAQRNSIEIESVLRKEEDDAWLQTDFGYFRRKDE